MNSPKVRTKPSDIRNRGQRQRLFTENSVGARIIVGLGDRSVSWLAAETGQPENTVRDAIKRGIAKVDLAVAIAAALDRSVDWLLTGREPITSSVLVQADDAEWIRVPEYDLAEISDESLGRPVLTAPIRRDWLYSIVRASTGLWLTRLRSDYSPSSLCEGDLIICRTLRPDELAEGHVCLWRFASTIVVGRFSVVPDELRARGTLGNSAGALAPYLDPSLGIQAGDVIVPPSAIEAGRYHLIGRVLGTMVRPL